VEAIFSLFPYLFQHASVQANSCSHPRRQYRCHYRCYASQVQTASSNTTNGRHIWTSTPWNVDFLFVSQTIATKSLRRLLSLSWRISSRYRLRDLFCKR